MPSPLSSTPPIITHAPPYPLTSPNAALSATNSLVFSSSVPTVILKHPSHPTSLPLNLTTTPFSSANLSYTPTATSLLASPFLSNISYNKKFPSNPPLLLPTPSTPSNSFTSLSRCATSAARFRRIVSSPAGLSAYSATAAVGDEMLYGALRLFSTRATGSAANAAPRRMPASPKALESVCMTTRLGCSRTHSAREADSEEAKST